MRENGANSEEGDDIMTTASLAATAADPVGAIGAGTLAQSLLDLLDRAGTEIDRDIDMAKSAILRASSILRVELDRSFSEQEPNSALGGLAPWQVKRVTAYIDAHLSDHISVEMLAAIAQRSTSHFCRSFKKTTGETPYNFITGRRLTAAKRMMLTSDAVLSEIAVACGFADQAHFGNRFREATGESPAAWRRERREKDARWVVLAAE